jgi:AcrR family transcriptional regulator
MVKDKRERILKASFKLFTTLGFHGTSTAKIAKEAGIATGTLFTYFKTKEELITEMYRTMKIDLVNTIGVEINESAPIRDQLFSFFQTMVKWGLEHPEMYLFREQYASSPYIIHENLEAVCSNTNKVKKLIQRVVTSGEVRFDNHHMFYTYIDFMAKYLVDYITNHEDVLTDELLNEQFSIIWSGIKVQ